MWIVGNRGVSLPDYKQDVLTHGIVKPAAADMLYIAVPDERVAQVTVGDVWKHGRFLWENAVHLPQYCPADGVVTALEKRSHPLFGDGWYATLSHIKASNKPLSLPKGIAKDTAEIARAAGILDERDGLPLFIKLQRLKGFGGTLVVDATATDPYMSASIGVLMDDPARLFRGLQLAADYIGAADYGVAVTRGCDGGKAVRAVCNRHLFVTARTYPTDRLVPSRCARPIAVCGVQALVALAAAVDNNEVMDTCVVTVHGDRTKTPRNLRVLNGTPASYVMQVCQAQEESLCVLGGVMTGIPFEGDIAVSAGVTCLLALNEPTKKPARSCIGCDACIRVCHRGLLPCEIARLYENMQYERLPAMETHRCDGCGACSYVCPAGREMADLVQRAKEAYGTIFVNLEGE